MRRSSIVAVSAFLLACSQATAATPDSHNPAHCIAAINYGNYWLGKGGKSDLVMQGTARALFEAKKIRDRGGSLDEANAESYALTKAYAKDRDAMNKLMFECLTAEDSDPKFQKEMPGLLALVRAKSQAAR